MGGAVFAQEGFEADDLIAAVIAAAKKESPAVDFFILTGDYDSLQLVDGGVKAFIVNRGIKNAVLFDAAAVKEKFGVAPQNIPALKALAGDSSDNIPGAVGIGPKVAAEVLEKYGNLENALAAATRADDYCFGAGDRGKKIKRILLENKEQVLKFQRLTAMRADAPVGEVLDKCSFSGFAGAAAQALLDIGLAGIAKRLPREGAGRPQTLF